MKRLLFLVFITPLLGLAQTGSISGNAFWKYNNYIGNKADASSEARLYSDSTSKPLTAICDLQGNFKFENLKPGNYLLIVKSKNTTDDWRSNFISLRYAPIAHYCSPVGATFDKSLFDSVSIYESYYNDVVMEKYGTFSMNKHQKKLDKAKKQTIDCIHRVFRNVPSNEDLYFYFDLPLNYPRKLFIKEIAVSANQSTSVVADFGVTYL